MVYLSFRLWRRQFIIKMLTVRAWTLYKNVTRRTPYKNKNSLQEELLTWTQFVWQDRHFSEKGQECLKKHHKSRKHLLKSWLFHKNERCVFCSTQVNAGDSNHTLHVNIFSNGNHNLHGDIFSITVKVSKLWVTINLGFDNSLTESTPQKSTSFNLL